MSQKIESFIRCLNYPVLYHCVGRDQGGELQYKECHNMSQKIESFIRCLNYPVLYHCVGCDQGGELQGVPRDEPED